MRLATAPADPARKTNPRSQAGDRKRSTQAAVAMPSTSTSAPTPPKTNLNLPQEKPGTAPAEVEAKVKVEHQAPPPKGTPALRPPPEDQPTGTARPEDAAWSPALQRLGKIAGRRRPRSGADTLFEPYRINIVTTNATHN